MRLGSEFNAWGTAIEYCQARLADCHELLRILGIGGNAIGSGVNTPSDYADWIAERLAYDTGLPLESGEDLYERCQSTADFAQLSGTLRTLALELIRIANDIRLLASGPNTGLGEIVLPPVQPGSSIMPGKVNPVMAEMLNMVCFHVVGADTCVAMACQAGQLELNAMMPIIAHQLSTSFTLLTNAVNAFVDRCVLLDWIETLEDGTSAERHGITADALQCERFLQRSTGLATLLNPVIGYDAAAEVMKAAKRSRRSVREVVVEQGLMSGMEFDALVRRSVSR
jgi:aspartate ammonia-lyase